MRWLTDAELMIRVRAGDDEAFAAIVDRYKDSLVRYLTRLTGSYDRAEEVAQEAFVRLYLNASKYREEGKLAPYLYRVATNYVRSELARVKRWTGVRHFFSPETIAQSTPQHEALMSEASTKVASALESLPVAYRAAVILREIEGWSYDEIAAALDCNSGTVKSRISRGRELLKRMLAPYWIGDRSERRTFG